MSAAVDGTRRSLGQTNEERAAAWREKHPVAAKLMADIIRDVEEIEAAGQIVPTAHLLVAAARAQTLDDLARVHGAVRGFARDIPKQIDLPPMLRRAVEERKAREAAELAAPTNPAPGKTDSGAWSSSPVLAWTVAALSSGAAIAMALLK